MILVRTFTDRYSGEVVAKLAKRKQYDASDEEEAPRHIGDVYILELSPDARLREIRRWLSEYFLLEQQATRAYKDAACIVERAMGSADFRVSESSGINLIPLWFSFLEQS